MFSGSIVALVAPFAGRAIDERPMSELVSWQVEQGSSAIAVNTAIGEAPTLTSDERSRVIALVRESAGRDVPIIAGVCTTCTVRGMEEAVRARAAGADGLLLSTPPYNRPSIEGVLRHLESIAGATDLPILIHNDPDRTRVGLASQDLGRIAALANVVGVVDATGAFAGNAGSSRQFSSYTSRDALSVPFLMAGGTGVISALANITPRLCAQLHLSVRAGLFSQATAIQRRLQPLVEAIGRQAEPAAVKYALFLLRNHFDPRPRLPLVRAPCATARSIAAALAGLRDDDLFG